MGAETFIIMLIIISIVYNLSDIFKDGNFRKQKTDELSSFLEKQWKKYFFKKGKPVPPRKRQFFGSDGLSLYFKENDNGMWELPMSSFVEKTISNKFFRIIYNTIFTNYLIALELIKITAKYDARYYEKTEDKDNYRNVFAQDSVKKIYDDAFIAELKEIVEKRAKSDAKNDKINNFLAEGILTQKMYQESYVKEKTKYQMREQSRKDNEEALAALMNNGASPLEAEEFKQVFIEDERSGRK